MVDSRVAADDTGGSESSDFDDTSLFQDARARFERRTGRAHIVNQHDSRVPQHCAGARDGERIAYVPMTLRSGQAGLSRRCAFAPQRADRRQANVPREVGGLIEPALTAPRRVQRHRDDHCGAIQHFHPALPHQVGEGTGERAAAFVLEGVNDRTQRPVVRADRPRAIDEPARPATTWAQRQGDADCPPSGQRITAAIAERWGDRQNRAPACSHTGP